MATSCSLCGVTFPDYPHGVDPVHAPGCPHGNTPGTLEVTTGSYCAVCSSPWLKRFTDGQVSDEGCNHFGCVNFIDPDFEAGYVNLLEQGNAGVEVCLTNKVPYRVENGWIILKSRDAETANLEIAYWWHEHQPPEPENSFLYDERVPSWLYHDDAPEDHFLSAWGSETYGRHVECPVHGKQFVMLRTDVQSGTFYLDGSHDERFHEELACGCQADCYEYAHDLEIQRSWTHSKSETVEESLD